MMLEVISPSVRELLPDDTVDCVISGLRFTEGPVWNPKRQSLLFSDILGNAIYEYREGTLSTYRCPSAMANGLALDTEGRLLSCEHAGRRVTREESDGSLVLLADRYEGKRLNSPNDVIVRSTGDIYFTDPPFGLTREYGVPGEREISYQGVYRLDSQQVLELVAGDFELPNGLALSPDERLIYVDDSQHNHIRVFDVSDDGSLVNGRLFAEMDARSGDGVADGLKTDEFGNVYVCGPSGIWIFDPSGNPLGILHLPEVVANLAWGGHDGRTLFITATTSVYRIHTAVRGAHVL